MWGTSAGDWPKVAKACCGNDPVGCACEAAETLCLLQAICIGVPGGRLARATQSWPLSSACVAAQCNDDGTISVLIKKLTSSGYETHPCPEGQNVDLSVIDGFQPGVRCHFPRSVTSRMQLLLHLRASLSSCTGHSLGALFVCGSGCGFVNIHRHADFAGAMPSCTGGVPIQGVPSEPRPHVLQSGPLF